MNTRSKWLGGWCLSLLSVASLAAASGVTRVVDAVKRADKAAVRALVQQQVDVNAAEPDGSTALHWAVQQDDLETVDLLIRAGANVMAANRYGVTPLAAACTSGNAAIIETLLKAGADANAALPEGETALMTAARGGNADAVKVLLAHGANVNATESWHGQTALMWAAAEDHAAVARALIEGDADIKARSNGGFTPLLFAVRAGRSDTVRVLLAAGASVEDTVQPKRSAPPKPGPKGTRYIGNESDRNLSGNRGGNTGPDGTTALLLAIINRNYDLAALLLDQGADPNAEGPGWTALHQLAWTRRPNILIGVPPPVPVGDSLELAKALLAHGADVNAPVKKEPSDGNRNLLTRIGATPFLLAAKAADAEFMRFLVANGADPLLTTSEHATPLMAAAGVGIFLVGENPGTNEEAFEAVKFAAELGSDVNAVDDNNETAMHGAAYRGSPAIVQFLFDKGAKLDLVNVIGWTPLIIAEGVFYPNTYKRQPEAAVLLRKLGANPQLGKRRPEDYAPFTDRPTATEAQKPQ